MFQMRQLLWLKKQKEVSEFKGIGILHDALAALSRALRQGTEVVQRFLIRLVQRMEKFGCKSHRYKKKTMFDIIGVVYEWKRKAA